DALRLSGLRATGCGLRGYLASSGDAAANRSRAVSCGGIAPSSFSRVARIRPQAASGGHPAVYWMARGRGIPDALRLSGLRDVPLPPGERLRGLFRVVA